MTHPHEALRALIDFVQNRAEHGDECPFWRQSGTEEDCICGLLNAREDAAAIAALTQPVEAQGEQDDGPHWSHRKPARSGVYGVRGFNFGCDPIDQFEAVVAVRVNEDDELVCNLHQSTSESDLYSWSLVDEMSEKFEWCRFEFAPPQPGDAA